MNLAYLHDPNLIKNISSETVVFINIYTNFWPIFKITSKNYKVKHFRIILPKYVQHLHIENYTTVLRNHITVKLHTDVCTSQIDEMSNNP